jgi:excisionase family DNA binding protein
MANMKGNRQKKTFIEELKRREGLITVPQAAAEIGVSVFTIQRWVRTGRINGKRVGDRKTYVRRREVEAAVTDTQGEPALAV